MAGLGRSGRRRRTLGSIAAHLVGPRRAMAPHPAKADGPLFPVVYEKRLPGDTEPGITAAEAQEFKAQGFLKKHCLLPEEALEPLRQLLWSRAPASLRRDDRSTWIDPHEAWGPATGQVGPDEQPEVEADPWRGELSAGPSWRFRSGGPDGLGSSCEFRAIANHERLLRCVGALIGEPVRRCSRTRGVYCVFPSRRIPQRNSLGPHVDGSCNMLSAMVLLEDSPPGCAALCHKFVSYEASKKLLRACSCGNFTLWPGSHAKIYHDFVTSQVGSTTRKGIAELVLALNSGTAAGRATLPQAYRPVGMTTPRRVGWRHHRRVGRSCLSPTGRSG